MSGTTMIPANLCAAPALQAQTTPAQMRVLAYVHLRNIHASTGAGRVARQITEHLSMRSDICLHVLADQADRARVLPLVGSPWNDYTFHTFEADTSRQQARWLALNRPHAEHFWPDAQLVYCTAESYVPTRSARSVVTLHDAAYFERDAHHADLPYWKQRAKWHLLFARLSRSVDLFHTVSQFSAERLAHFFPTLKDRLRVVRNGVAPHFFHPATPAGIHSLSKIGLADRQYILVPGGLHYRKNAELVLLVAPRLLACFPHLTIAVVNHSAPEYNQRAQSLGERFRLLGFISDEALRALYGAASAVWFPSRYEGFGLPVIEAMACGTPVVASRASSLPEIAGDAALLANAASANEHMEALAMLLDDSSVAQKYAARGRERAAAFTWTESARQMAAHFRSLL